MKLLYESANNVISDGNRTKPSIKITEGVLQGDNISPLSFSLYIPDIVSFFRAHRAKVLNIKGLSDIILLKYADNLAIFSSLWFVTQINLKCLKKYCEINFCKRNSAIPQG